MLPRLRFVSFVLALLAIDCHVRAESPSLLLEKGLFQEQTAGNLDSAISIYRQIVQQEKDDRAVAAHAMYRLGECYAKKGQMQLAISTLQQLVRKFPAQTDVVEKANARLVALKEKASPTAPPIIMRTNPPALAEDVDPRLDKITVTFDRPMVDGSWSWTGGGDTMPASTGPVSYDRMKRTCSRPSKLEPGKVYWVGINSPSFRNFQSASGVPAPWYAIVFATKSADGKPTPIPEKMKEEAKRINAAAMGETAQPTSPAPQVLKTTPEAFDNAVDPTLDHMQVVFDQPMADKSWSWTGTGDTYPESGVPSYDATRKICTRSVKLQPGKVYWVGVNSPSHRNFQSEAGVPAPWYIILFATKSADGKPTPIPEDMLKEAKKINAAVAKARASEQRVRSATGSSRAPTTYGNSIRKLLDEASRREWESCEESYAKDFEKVITASRRVTDKDRSSATQQLKEEVEHSLGKENLPKQAPEIAFLGELGGPEAVSVLIKVIKDPTQDNRPRWIAARGLGRSGDKRAIPVLIGLLDHMNKETRVYAKAGLAELTGVYFGDDKAKWQEWWKGQAGK